jgi:hypothetical protein
VRQDRQGGFYVEGLTQAQVASAAAAQQRLQAGLLWRHTRSHALNSTSSRSHCITTVTFACGGGGGGGGGSAGGDGAAEGGSPEADAAPRR